MSQNADDSFWVAPRAWRHSLIEGVRVAAIGAITIWVVRGLGWIFHTEQDLGSWLWSTFLMGLLIGAPLLPVFAVWTRLDIWHGNKVKPK